MSRDYFFWTRALLLLLLILPSERLAILQPTQSPRKKKIGRYYVLCTVNNIQICCSFYLWEITPIHVNAGPRLVQRESRYRKPGKGYFVCQDQIIMALFIADTVASPFSAVGMGLRAMYEVLIFMSSSRESAALTPNQHIAHTRIKCFWYRMCREFLPEGITHPRLQVSRISFSACFCVLRGNISRHETHATQQQLS